MKQDLIILHGWNLSGKRFHALADRFRKAGFRVFAPDMPGFGDEKAPDVAWHVSDYAEFLHRYITKHTIKNPILVGHSFGGRVSLKYAELYPSRVKKIVLTGTPGYSPIPSKKLRFFLIISKIGGIIFQLPGLRHIADGARKWLYYIAGAREFLRAEGAMRQTFKYIVADDLSTAMRSVAVPCLLVWGQNDTIVPVSVAERMRDTIRGSRLIIMPEMTHAVPFEHPAEFAARVMEFLQT